MRRILAFAELAVMYFPGCTTSKNAVRCLSRWIKGCQRTYADRVSALQSSLSDDETV